MGYTKQTWTSGDVITAGKMNHIEEGLAACDKDIQDTNKVVSAIQQQIGGITLTITTISKSVTLSTNEYVSPFTHHANMNISESDIETYGEPISVSAVAPTAAPVPVSMNATRRSCAINSMYESNTINITFIKLDIPVIEEDANE